MADLSITATSVLAVAGSHSEITVTAGEAITAGQPVYKKAADSKYYKTDSNAEATAAAAGIALNSALAANAPLTIITEGLYNPGAAVTVGHIYCVSDTAGGIIPHADLSSTEYTTILGVATTTAQIKVHIWASGAVIA